VQKTNLNRASFDTGRNVIELVGLKDDVEDAKMMIESHCDYYSVYKDMDTELANIEDGFYEIEGKGKGKGKKGGKKGGKGGFGKFGDRDDWFSAGKGGSGFYPDERDSGKGKGKGKGKGSDKGYGGKGSGKDRDYDDYRGGKGGKGDRDSKGGKKGKKGGSWHDEDDESDDEYYGGA